MSVTARSLRLGLVVVAALSLKSSPTYASDHIDGPVTLANAVADITDLYAFPTPGNANSLTMILDVYPFVSSSGHFSDKVNYNFILRKANLAPDGSKIVTDANSEVVISCRFVTPQQVSGIQVICASNEAQPRIMGQIAFNETQQPKVGNNIELFGGRRADPFFLSKDFASAFMTFKQGKPDGKNVMNNLNCLSIVMNVDLNLLFPPGTAANTKPDEKTRKVAQAESYFVAVAAESVAIDAPGAKPRRIDRVGRPEITNVSLNMKSGDPEVRDTYNVDRPYAVPANKAASYVARLEKNIGRYDMIDGKRDWDAKDLNKLSEILVEDYLVVDPFTPCQGSSFFEIERSVLMGAQHQSCGGRDPKDNAVNKLYTLFEKGAPAMPSLSVNDGLHGPTKPISPIFPYLANPYNGFAAWITQKIANAAKGYL